MYKEYKDLVSLEDGGAVAVLYEQNDGSKRSTLCRWDAQGNLINEIILHGFSANSLEILGDKMIVCGEERPYENGLMAVTGTGQIVCRESISSSYTMGRFLIALDGNTVARGQPVSGEDQSGDMYNWDVQINVVDIN